MAATERARHTPYRASRGPAKLHAIRPPTPAEVDVVNLTVEGKPYTIVLREDRVVESVHRSGHSWHNEQGELVAKSRDIVSIRLPAC